MTVSSSGKDPIQLLEEADGNPTWLKEALQEIFHRLPPSPPPAPPITGPSWDPRLLAKLLLDPARVPLSTTDRWHLAEWLQGMSKKLTDGAFDEGDSKEGFFTIHVLGHAKPSSGSREKRNGV